MILDSLFVYLLMGLLKFSIVLLFFLIPLFLFVRFLRFSNYNR